jgi:O-acetyl-ADP-ribose deacetylase (regulator of RNase III)
MLNEPSDPFELLGVAPAGRARLRIVAGDLTRFPADAIVNAANRALRGGGGVDGAIHRAAGPRLMEELRDRYDACPTGSAVITAAYQLPARWVIHAVGPVWQGGDGGEPALLASAYQASLALAEEAGARTIALPAISCGIYGYPLPEGARLALETVRRHLEGDGAIVEATFVLRSADAQDAFIAALRALPGAGLEDRRSRPVRP